jgi:FSR family fosmidomycin resistance protein-like MFS transporter
LSQATRELVEVAGPSSSRVGVAARYWTLVSSHSMIDVFPILFTSLLWPLQTRLNLHPWQVTVLIMATPIASGLLQPLAAYVTDKLDTRMFGPAGLAVGATCVGSIGLAQSFAQLITLQIIGVIATGMYHPIATALAGQSGSRVFRNGRAQAIGIFIAAGMVGHSLGAELGPEINKAYGMTSLMWLIPPALLVALVLHLTIRHVRHRHENHLEMHAALSAEERGLRWRVVTILTCQNCLRFTVNIGLLAVMFNVWAKSRVLRHAAGEEGVSLGSLLESKPLAEAASIQVGHLSVALTMGMGLGVLLTGRLVKAGTERGPLIYLSLIGAVFTAILGLLGNAIEGSAGFGSAPMALVYICTGLTAMGFFATFPIATSLAQRLQPGRTSFVTSLMMGVGWAFASVAAPLAVLLFGGTSINAAPTLEPWRINIGFYGFATLLVIAGLSTLLIPKDLVERAAEHH